MTVEVPLPPVDLAARVGGVHANGLVLYEEVGRRSREEILALLPEDWSFAGKRILDFGCGAGRTLRHFLEEAETGEFFGCDIDGPSIAWLAENMSPPLHAFPNEETPPLALEGDSFDLVWAISVFTHISDHWAAWLVELHRVLREGGLLVATILGPPLSEDWGPVPADERVGRGADVSEANRVGMNVLHYGRSWDQGGPAVFISEWWLREHWGRAFDVLSVREAGFIAGPQWKGQGVALLGKRAGEITVEELERIDPSEPREVVALEHNIRQLHYESQKAREAVDWLEGERSALTEQLARASD